MNNTRIKAYPKLGLKHFIDKNRIPSFIFIREKLAIVKFKVDVLNDKKLIHKGICEKRKLQIYIS